MGVLEIIFGIFAIVGALDKIFGNRLKLGEEFEKGIASAGSLVLAAVGMITLTPTISKILVPVLGPVAEFFHIDQSFIGSFIANDMGGAIMAEELSPGTIWATYNGLIVASMLGVTVCFTIPIPFKTIDKKHHKDVLSGILCGIATMPIGCIVGGLMIGCPFFPLLLNTLPVILMSVIICVGLILNPDLCRKIFGIIASIILVIMTVGLGAGVFAHITGIVLIPHMKPVMDGFKIVAGVAIVLSGVYPLLKTISIVFEKPLSMLGKVLKINNTSVIGLITSLVNSIPTFALVEKMNAKGIIMNMAFAVSGAFVFGSQIAFTMAFNKDYVFAMIVGKLVAAACALVAAHFLYKNSHDNSIADEHIDTGEKTMEIGQ